MQQHQRTAYNVKRPPLLGQGSPLKKRSLIKPLANRWKWSVTLTSKLREYISLFSSLIVTPFSRYAMHCSVNSTTAHTKQTAVDQRRCRFTIEYQDLNRYNATAVRQVQYQELKRFNLDECMSSYCMQL
eukprot:11719-Heterococcus_DN1.PRE.12